MPRQREHWLHDVLAFGVVGVVAGLVFWWLPLPDAVVSNVIQGVLDDATA